jgi:membrane-associated phospholipid phosphatase
MEALFDIGLEATRWLQDTYPQLESFFEFISELGREEFYLAILPLIYWCLNKRLGSSLAYVFLFSNAFNALFKHTFRAPRPFWIDDKVGLASEISYGVPSGHTQAASTLYIFLAAWLKRSWVWIPALVMVILMGLSRIFLGVHFVHDVVVGLLIALLVLLGYYLWQRYLAPGFGKRILGQRLLASLLISVAIALIYTVVRMIIGEPDLTVSWAEYISDAELTGSEDMATAVGALLGIGVGINLETSRSRFRVGGPVWQRIVRYLLGIAVTVAIWAGLKQVFPADPLWLAIPLRILRYFLILIWVGYYAPLTFIRVRLAEAEPDPGISLKM